MTDLKATAKRALASLDLTNLNDDCEPGDIRDLCARAFTPHGHVAAVCIWPRFVAQARGIIGARPVKIATVVNFPSGEEPAGEVMEATRQAVADGADEIDMVIPYLGLMEGREEAVFTRIKRIRSAAGGKTVKAILETGVLSSPELIRKAADLAIEAKADFIKTSTGKVGVNATPQAVRIMLEAIRDSGADVGIKPSGGVKTTEQAARYLDIADEIMGPDWAGPKTFRFGASGVLDDLLATISGGDAPAESEGY